MPDEEKEQKATYGFEVVDALPARTFARESVWDPIIDRVKNELPAGKFALIAAYPTATAASSAATGLRNRFGPVNVGGLEFTTRKHSQNGEDRSGVFVSYDASRVDKAAAKEWSKVRDAKLAVYRARAKKRAADKKAEEPVKAAQ